MNQKDDVNQNLVSLIPIDSLVYSGRNPRQDFRGLEELAQNIKIHGILQPIIVRPKGKQFEVVAGERRVRAAKEAGIEKIPSIIKTLTDKQTDEIRLIENIHRDDLTNAEKGEAVISLWENYPEHYPTFKSVADNLNIKYDTLNYWLRYARRLSSFVRNSVISSTLGEEHARFLLKYEQSTQDKLAKVILRNDLNTVHTRDFLKLYDSKPNFELDELALKAKGIEKVNIPLDKLSKKAKKEVTQILQEQEKKKEQKTTQETKRKRSQTLKETIKRKEARKNKTVGIKKPTVPLSHFVEETKSSLHPNNKEIKSSLENKIPEHVNNLIERVADQIKEAVAQAPEKVERISEIVNEELSGMRKRLEIFPEKSKKPQVNILNELTGAEWLTFTKSWYVFNALEKDLSEEKSLTAGLTEEHPATFSPSMISDYVRFFTKSNDVVLDPFVGIGTTLVACIRTGRQGIGIDINDQYVDIAKKRIEGFSNQKVTLGDAWNIEEYNLPQIDYCITSPPYFDMLEKIDVTQKKRIKKGLATDYGDSTFFPDNVDEYIKELVILFSKIAEKTKDKGFLTVILQNYRDKGRMIPLAWKFAIDMQEYGDWDFKGERIWCQSQKKLHPFGQKFDFVSNIHHHYCLIFRKASKNDNGS